MVYLIHAERRLYRSHHYIGWVATPADFERRMAQHRAGSGSKLLAEMKRQGIGWQVVATWPDADRKFERQIKNRKNVPRYFCPICRPARSANGGTNGRRSTGDHQQVHGR